MELSWTAKKEGRRILLFSEVLKERNWVETQVGRDATGGAKEFTSPRLPYSEGVFNLQGEKEHKCD